MYYKEKKVRNRRIHVVFFIRNQFIRNLQVESRKIKKLLQLHFYDYFSNKKLFFIRIYISFSVVKVVSRHRKLLSKRSHYIAEKKNRCFLKMKQAAQAPFLLREPKIKK